MSEKLTGPQLALLRDIAGHSQYVSDSYQPRNRLLALGYVELTKIGLGGVLKITEAGRLAVAANEGRP
jgi:hypothetical protein